MTVKAMVAAVVFCLALSGRAMAEVPGEVSTMGNGITVANLVSTLQQGGYQALIAPRPQQAPEVLLGVITSGVNGANVSIGVFKCPDSKTDEVCTLVISAKFNDGAKHVDDKDLFALNAKSTLAKVVPFNGPNDVHGFSVVYWYMCRGVTDTRFMVPLIREFGTEVGRVLMAYRPLVQPQ